MIVKLRDKVRGDHIHTKVFIGEDEDHLVFSGELVFRVGEWQLFGAALLLGAEKTKGHLTVLVPDDKEIAEEFSEKSREEEVCREGLLDLLRQLRNKGKAFLLGSRGGGARTGQ